MGKIYKYTIGFKVKLIMGWMFIITILFTIFGFEYIGYKIAAIVITLYLVIANVNNSIKIEKHGIEECRNFNFICIKWESIRRIEYVKLSGGKNACAMNIHGPIDMTKTIYIENNFENCLDIWKYVIEECNKRDIKPIIDEKILGKLKEANS